MVNANNQRFPTDISQLQSYFNPPLDPAIPQRYAVMPSSTVPNVSMGGDWMVTQKAAVDGDYDTRFVIGPNGYGSTGPGGFEPLPQQDTLSTIYQSYVTANNGQKPTDPSQLLPYATTPEQQAALQKAIQMKNAEGN